MFSSSKDIRQLIHTHFLIVKHKSRGIFKRVDLTVQCQIFIYHIFIVLSYLFFIKKKISSTSHKKNSKRLFVKLVKFLVAHSFTNRPRWKTRWMLIYQEINYDPRGLWRSHKLITSFCYCLLHFLQNTFDININDRNKSQ